MISSIKSILSITLILILFFSCKKKEIIKDSKQPEELFNPFTHQTGTYIGNLRFQATYHKTDWAQLDSITGEPIDNEMKLVSSEMVDTTIIDTARIVVSKDSIFFYSFNGINDFLISEENYYRKQYPGYSSTDFTINKDTLKIYDTYVINRGSDYPSQANTKFIGIKQK